MGRFTRFATQPRRVPPPPTKACSTPTNAALQAVGDLFSFLALCEGLAMAYSDPSLLREFEARVRLNERENELVSALCNFTGQQKGVLLREIILDFAQKVLSGQADLPAQRSMGEAPLSARIEAA
jgi:hypothetical protein